MLDGALSFARKNIRAKTIVEPETGKRIDRSDYPLTTVREAIGSPGLQHPHQRDAIQLPLFEDRFELRSPIMSHLS